jgi:hypothetical protein
MITHLRARAGLILRIACFAALGLISGFLLAALNGDRTASAAGSDDGGGLLGAVTTPLTDTVAPLVSDVAPVVEQVTEPVAPVVQSVAPVVEQVAEPVAPVAEAVAPMIAPVAEVLSPVVQSVAPVVEQVAEVVAPVTQAVAPIVTPVVEVVAPVTDAISPVVAPLAAAVAPVVGPVTDAPGPVLQPTGPTVDPVTRPAAVVPPVGTSGGQPPSAPPAPVPSAPPGALPTGPQSGPAAPAAGSTDVAATIDRALGTASGNATTDPARRFRTTPGAPAAGPPEHPNLFTTGHPSRLMGAADSPSSHGPGTPYGPLTPAPVIAPSLASSLLAGGGGDRQPTPLTVAILAAATATLFLLWRRIAPLVAWRSRRELSDIERPG